MKKESLEKAKSILTAEIINSNINQADKIELIIKIYSLLNDIYCDEGVKKLQKKRHIDKYGSNNKRI